MFEKYMATEEGGNTPRRMKSPQRVTALPTDKCSPMRLSRNAKLSPQSAPDRNRLRTVALRLETTLRMTLCRDPQSLCPKPKIDISELGT